MPCAGPVTCARAHLSGVAVCGFADGRLSVLDPRLPEEATAVRLHQSAQAKDTSLSLRASIYIYNYIYTYQLYAHVHVFMHTMYTYKPVHV